MTDFSKERVDVDELQPGMTGVWLVVSQGSRHEWDLDTMTYMRIAGQDSKSGRCAMDSQRMLITRVGRWPRVGSTSLVYYDDPARPLDYEHFRRSSRIESITRIAQSPSALPPVRPAIRSSMPRPMGTPPTAEPVSSR